MTYKHNTENQPMFISNVTLPWCKGLSIDIHLTFYNKVKVQTFCLHAITIQYHFENLINFHLYSDDFSYCIVSKTNINATII